MKTFIEESNIKELHLPEDVQFVNIVTQELIVFREEYLDTYIGFLWERKIIQIQLLSRGDNIYIQFSRSEFDPMEDEALRIKASDVIEKIAHWIEHKSPLRLKFIMGGKRLVMDWCVISNIHQYPLRLEESYLTGYKNNMDTYFAGANTIAGVVNVLEKRKWSMRLYGKDGEMLANFLQQHYGAAKVFHSDSIEIKLKEPYCRYETTSYLFHRFQELGYTLVKEELFDD